VSNINYISINENFPVAGQDNDTQVFRDNFDTIKTSLRVAKEELSALQDSDTGAALLSQDNDFHLNKIQNALLQKTREQKLVGGIYESESGINWEQGSYQIWIVNADVLMAFENFPGDPAYTAEISPVGLGRMTLELYNSGSTPHDVTFTTSSGTVIKSLGFPGVTSGAPVLTLEDSENPVIIEVWRHSAEVIFMRYVGVFA
jgi:hypothetical protein